jgi:hypothetical protein
MQRIVADGEWRWRESPGFRAQDMALKETVEARYADEMSTASFAKRCWLRIRIKMEIDREIRRIAPSPESLY